MDLNLAAARRRTPRALAAALAIVVASSLGACSSTGAARPESPNSPQAAKSAAAAQPEARDLSEALLAGEFAWQDGRQAAAAKHYARAAQLSGEAKIAEHATRVALVAKEWDLARQDLARWRELAPDAAGIEQSEAVLALSESQPDTADEKLRALLALGEEGRRLVAQVILASTSAQSGIEVVQRLGASADLPGGVNAAVLLSQIALQLKDAKLALTLAERAVERFPVASAFGWRGRLLTAGELRDSKRAKQDFERALKLDPNDKTLRLTYAAVLDEDGDPAAAARFLAQGKPEDELLVARAAYAARANDQGLMKSAYEALKALPPPHTEARLELLGQLAELTGAKKEALAWYREIGHGEHWLSAQLRIPVLLDDLGQPAQALASIEALRAEGIEDDEQLANSFLLESELHTRHGAKALALASFARGLVALPDNRALLYGRALLNEQMDRIDDAERDLRRIVAMDPEDADALNALGYTLADRTTRYEEALKYIEQALAKKPEEPAIVDSMGWVHFKLGRRSEALEFLRRAFQLRADPEIAAHLGEVLWAGGQREEAKKIWAQGRKLDAKNALLKRTMERLQR